MAVLLWFIVFAGGVFYIVLPGAINDRRFPPPGGNSAGYTCAEGGIENQHPMATWPIQSQLDISSTGARFQAFFPGTPRQKAFYAFAKGSGPGQTACRGCFPPPYLIA
jgi:hypothetical protein